MPSSLKTSKICEHVGSIKSYKILPLAGMMRCGQVSKLVRQVSNYAVPASSCWPSPRKSDFKETRQLGYSLERSRQYPTLTDAAMLYHRQAIGRGVALTMVLNPRFCERLMAIPEDWTHIDDVNASQALGIPCAPPKQ